MKYTTFAAIAALPVAAIMVSCSSKEESLANDMIDIANEMADIIADTTADNVADQNEKIKEIAAQMKEVTKELAALTPEQIKALDEDADLKAEGEKSQKRMQDAIQSLMKKDMSLFVKLFEGVDIM